MRELGITGATHGRAKRPTVPAADGVRTGDLVNRRFTTEHPNALGVADFTYVATRSGTLYVAFVIDVFSRRIVGWIGSVGDAYDNALAESTIGLYKTELINRRGPWRTRDQVEYVTLESVHAPPSAWAGLCVIGDGHAPR